MMKTSIALCTYNGEKYLEEQLESYSDQIRQPDELVICDDCSTDSTRELIRSFTARSPFKIRLVCNERNLGYIKNFEKAVSLCTGDIIFLSDQDDIWRPEKLSTIRDLFDRDESIGMVYADATIVSEKLEPRGETMWQKIGFDQRKQEDFRNGKALDWLLRDGYVLGSSMAFRATLKRTLVPIPEDTYFIHDNWIALIASCLSNIGIINQPLTRYRQHDGQASSGLKNYDSSRLQTLIYSIRRHNQYEGTIRQLEILLDRLEGCADVSGEVIAKIGMAKKHFEMRAGIPVEIIPRLRKVSQELIAGRYDRFSNGVRSAVRDLISTQNQDKLS